VEKFRTTPISSTIVRVKQLARMVGGRDGGLPGADC
jgi:hypothetical protein